MFKKYRADSGQSPMEYVGEKRCRKLQSRVARLL